MAAATASDLDDLMPVVELVADRWWTVECPWCGASCEVDRVWRAYRWRHEHRCYSDEVVAG